MSDLYQVLGVDRDAGKQDIRAAYRQRSKSAHPDMPGGSPKKFSLIKKAHDILSDDERRRKYDATGDESEQQPNNELGNAMQVLQIALDAVLSECLKAKREPTEVDLIAALREKIGNDIAEAKKNKHTFSEMRKIDEKLIARFSKKKGKKKNKREMPQIDVFESLIKGRLAALTERIARMDEHIERSEYALDLIEDWVYRKDEERQDSRMQGIGNFCFTIGGM